MNVEELEIQVKQQQAKIASLEGTGKKASAIAAIIGLAGTVLGLFVGFIAFSFTVKDELDAWEIVKTQHQSTPSGGVLYDHRGLEGHDITAALEELGYPNPSLIALKSDIPAEPDLTNVVRFDSEVIFRLWSQKDYALGVNLGVAPGNAVGLATTGPTVANKSNQIWTVIKPQDY